MADTIQKRREEVAAALLNANEKIFELEESYFSECTAGNLMKGYENFADAR